MTGTVDAPANRRRVLTDVERSRISELAEKGLSSGRIAQILGRARGTVSWFMYFHGLKAPKTRLRNPVRYVRKNGVAVNQYSREEDAFIQALRCQSFSTVDIAHYATKRFGVRRTPHSIHNRLIVLSNLDEAETAGGKG